MSLRRAVGDSRAFGTGGTASLLKTASGPTPKLSALNSPALLKSVGRRPRKWAASGLARIPRPSLGTRWALAFVAIAGFAWWLADVLNDWGPNIAAEALSIAATIVIVERIVRHEARARLLPRIENAMDALRWEFRDFVHGVAVDYAGTHLHTFRPLPGDALAFLDQWLADKDAQDACQATTWNEDRDSLPLVLHQGNELGKALRHYRELDREVMEPELVRAIDDYLWLGLQWAGTSYGLAKSGHTGGTLGQGYTLAETTIVRQARAFGQVLARHDPRGRIQFDDLTITAMQEHSEGLRKRGGEIAGWRWYPRRVA
jgi:hypothetical protein